MFQLLGGSQPRTWRTRILASTRFDYEFGEASNSAEQEQDENDQQDQAKTARGAIPPSPAMGPGRESAHQ